MGFHSIGADKWKFRASVTVKWDLNPVETRGIDPEVSLFTLLFT